MQERELFDSHSHLFQSPTAEASFRAVTGAPGDLPGDTSDAIATMDRLGVRRMVILPLLHARQDFDDALAKAAATGRAADPDTVRNEVAARWSEYNSWAAATATAQPDRFIAMIGTDPVLLGPDWAAAEIERGLADGATGLKLMPGFIGCRPDDERLAVVWEAADRHSLPVVSMCGLLPTSDLTHPDHYEAVASAYPRLKLILAHLGLGAEDRVVRLTRRYDNVFTDTSAWFEQRFHADSWLSRKLGTPALTPEQAVDIFREIGTDRILFGTNFGIRRAEPVHEAFSALPLTPSERAQISSENHRRVYDDWL
jgi:predicted TIM-barrel fold metal-dependent hydrolase